MNQPSSRARIHVRTVLHVAPHERAHWAALRGLLTTLLPCLLLAATDRDDLMLYAVFGAFTCLYGRQLAHTARFTMQWRAAVALVLAVSLGVFIGQCADRSLLSIPVAAGLATVVAWWAERHDWRPPGSTFVVFAFAASSSLATSPHLALEALAVCAATAALGLGIGQGGRVSAWLHRRGSDAPYPLRGYASGRPTEGLHLARYAVAVVIAGGLTTVLGLGHPYWAIISAVVPLNVLNLHHQLARGVQRLVGTLVGVALAGAILWSAPQGWSAALVLATLFGLMELTMARNYGLSMIFLTPLALVQGNLASAAPVGTLLMDRALETCIGVGIGMATAWLLRRRSSSTLAGATRQ